MEIEAKKQIVQYFLKKGILLKPEIINNLPDNTEPEQLYRQITATESKPEQDIKVVYSYKERTKKRDVQAFISFFNARYKSIERMLRMRPEMQNITSIARLRNKQERENVALIGMVRSKQITKAGNIMLELEDQTGSIKVLVNANKPNLYAAAKDIVLDEVIGVTGTSGQNIVFTKNILWPDVPHKDVKKAPEESYAIVLSDLHVGSKLFLAKQFNQFLEWINNRIGTEQQREIASKVKYVFICGDLIDGVGVYPEQDSELEIKDVYEQYKQCAELLKKIPKNIKLIICPGNHDAMRISEPQPELYKDFAAPMWELPNAIMVSNPSLITVGISKQFPGLDVLLYHGYSFDYFVATVDSIRLNGGYDRADLIMQFLLQRRHLAPTHTSTLYLPEDTDPLVIENVPDIFITGHIHKSIAATYRGITMICGSCWQARTTFQTKVGHHPEPACVPAINLATRQVKLLKFETEHEQH